MNLRLLSLACACWGALAASASAQIEYNFDDGTLQGWSQVSQQGASLASYPFAATTDTLGNRVLADSGSHKVMLYQGDLRSVRHATGLLRSPEFTLGEHSQISFKLLGGAGTANGDPANAAALGADSVDSSVGYAGVALRRNSDGAYLLYGRRSSSGQSNNSGWENIIWGSQEILAAIANDDVAETYTLDFFDNVYGDWGWIALDTVSIYEDGAPYQFYYKSEAGKMLTFNGTQGYDLSADWSGGVLPASSLSAEAWLRSTSTDEMALLSLGSASGDSLWVGSNSAGLFFEYTVSGVTTRVQRTSAGGAVAMKRNEWLHVAVTLDEATGRVKIYVDSELYHDKIVGNVAFNFASDARLYVGSKLGQSHWLKGSIDEVRIWDVALSHQDIRGYANLFREGNEPGLIGLYKFDGLSGGTVADASAAGRNLTPRGFDAGSFAASAAHIPSMDPAFRDFIRNAQWDEREIQPGIVYKTHLFSNLWGGLQSLYVLEINPEVADVRFQINAEPDGAPYRTTSSVAAEAQAVVAINGSYWATGGMINNKNEPWDKATENQISVYQRVNGKDVAPTFEYHAIPNARFGQPAGSVETVDQDYGDDGAFVFNADSTQWGVITRPQPHSGVGSSFTSGWEGFNQWDNAMSSGPLMLQDGEVVFVVDNAYSMWDGGSSWNYQTENYPFTAVGIREDGTVVLVCGDGRQGSTFGHGLRQKQIAQVLLALDCVDGIRLDGGGSSTMYLADEGVVNSPSDGRERALPSHLLVIPKSVEQVETPDSISIEGPVSTAVSDSYIAFAPVDSGSLFFTGVMTRQSATAWSAIGLRPASAEATSHGGVEFGRNGASSGFAVFDYFDNAGKGSAAARVPAVPDSYTLGIGTYRIVGEVDFDAKMIRAWFTSDLGEILDINKPLIEEPFTQSFTYSPEKLYLRLGGDAVWTQVNLRTAANGGARAETFAAITPQPVGTMIERGAVWSYLDDGSDQGTAWRAVGFDDSDWKTGAAELGYGDGNEATVIGFGPDSRNKYPAYFFRKKIELSAADIATIERLRFDILRDDGVVVYINGNEVLRDNMPEGDIGYLTYANGTVDGANERTFFEFNVSPEHLRAGVNVIAVSIHQDRPTSSDVSFDLGLEAITAAVVQPVEQIAIARGSVWKYLDDGSDQGTAWRNPAFDDSAWQSGPAELGYGDGNEATVLSFGGNSSNKYPATFFRHNFSISDAGSVKNLQIHLLRDDGAVLYLNGQEILRDNMPAGEIGYRTYANGTVDGANERTYFEFTVPASALVSGENVLAVSIHQDRPSSSDISFDMEMKLVPMPHPDAPVFSGDVIAINDAVINSGYTGTLADLVTDANGDRLFFKKISGPDWLIINEDGTFSGTPGAGDTGLNEFVVSVTDNKDGTTTAVIQIRVDEAPELARAPMPNSENALRFGIVPDTQGSTNGVPTAEARAVAEQLLIQQPVFAIHVGDVTDGNHSGDNKMVELNYLNQLLTTPLLQAGIHLYPVRGNHDTQVHTLTSSGTPVWQAAYPHLFTGSTALIDPTDVPGGSAASPNNTNYSFVLNPAPNTYLIGLDMWQGGSNSNYSDWVAAKMAEIRAGNPDAHIFGYSHSGLFASANHPAMTQYIGSPADFIAAGHANQIDGWFSGHNHIYDRSMAIDAQGRASFFNITVGSASSKFYVLSRAPVEGQHINRIIDSTKIDNRPLAYQMVTINGSFVTVTTYMSPKNASGGFSDWKVWDEFTYSNKGDKFTVGSGQNYSDRNIVATAPESAEYIGTSLRLVDGVNSDATVHTAGSTSFTQYRTISVGWWAREAWHEDDSRQIVSDVASIYGMRDTNERNRSDVYTLVMGFDPMLSPLHRSNLSLVAFLDDDLEDANPGNWIEAVDATLGTPATAPVFRAPLPGDAVGTWGIDLENNEVWARLDYQGDFAIASNVIDTDNDGLADEWEMLYFGTLAYGPNDDPDGDGLTNLQEQFLGTNPTLADTDGDLINDGLEYALGLDPLAPNTELTNAIFEALRGNLNAQRAHGLYTQESLGNLSIHPLIEITNEAEAILRVRVQESTDLKEWNEIGQEVILTVPVNSDRQFFRLMAH